MKLKQSVKKFLRFFGPGVITGVADDDPAGIATYTQTGAQFGYGQLWAVLFALPLLLAIQEACARIGAVTGKGLAAVINTTYGKTLLFPMVLLVILANIVNIGADIGAMAEAAHLIIPLNFIALALLFTIGMLLLEIFFTYEKYANILKCLCLVLLAYPLTAIIVTDSWSTVLKSTFIPHIEWSFHFLLIITAVLGTTISPYLFFWQASEEVEEERAKHLKKIYGRPKISWHFIRHIRIDTFLGMLFSLFGAWSIIVVSAGVLHSQGIHDVKNIHEAAKALEPFVQALPNADYVAKWLFAIGIIGTGLLSIPILAGSAAYALSETFKWREGLNLKFQTARGFYGIIIVAMLFGLAFNFLGISPFKALIYSAVINGIVAVPLIFVVGLIAKNKNIMGKYKSGWLSNLFVAITFLWMIVVVVAMAITPFYKNSS